MAELRTIMRTEMIAAFIVVAVCGAALGLMHVPIPCLL